MIKTKVIAIAAFAMFLAASAAGPARAEPWKIRVGWVTAPTHMQPIIDALQKRRPELFPNAGKSYVVESVHFQGTTPQIQALAINELEIASFGPEALALAVGNAHLDVRMIADVFQDGVPGYTSVTYVVRKDSPIHKVEDLRGKAVASNAIGSFGDSAMRIMMRKHGLSDADFTTVEVKFPTMPAMLDEGKVEMINLLPKFRYMLTQGKYRVLFTGADSEGRIQAVLWAMRADVIAAHRPALVDFLEDHVRAVRWLLDPAHHEETVALVSEVTKQASDQVAYVYTKDDTYHSPDGLPDVQATQRALDVELQYHLIKQAITISPKYVDLGPIKEADRRLHKGS